MKKNHTLGQRCMAYILLISLFLQSCNSPAFLIGANKQGPVPMGGMYQDQAEDEGEDLLQGYNYKDLKILTRSDRGHNLPIIKQPYNTTGEEEEFHEIDEKTFRRQNVSGKSMRCFFNAAGLDAGEQIVKLREQQNDPVVRYMIANEIVSAAANPNQLRETVKKAINYELYIFQRGDVSGLETKRSQALHKQNPDANQQNTQAIPSVLQNTSKKDDKILEDLRQRACSLEAFNAFLNDHIGGEEMMVALHDVEGDNKGDNPNSNYTSIDAIAYVNNLGIKIYQPTKGGLRLAHQFIPERAIQVVYLFHDHENSHFQALVYKETGKEDNYSHSPKRKHSLNLKDYSPSQLKKQKYEEELEQEKDPKRILKEEARGGNNPEDQFKLAKLYEETFQEKYGIDSNPKAIKWYKKAASNGHKESQERLKQIRYVPIDDDLLGGCIRALDPYHLGKVNSDLKTQDSDYKLKLSDITFMDLDRHKVPSYIELAANSRRPSYLYNPLYSSTKTFLYEDTVLAVDMSTCGEDETAYCVTKRSKDRYFVTALKGYEGGYKKRENRKGDGPEMWRKIAKQVIKHGVKYVYIESTSDIYVEALKAKIEELGKKKAQQNLSFKPFIPEIYAKNSVGNKEDRIMDNLLPLFKSHSIFMDRKVLMKDFKAPIDMKFKWFYQLTNLTSNKEKGSRLRHDDRIDAFSMALQCLKDRSEKKGSCAASREEALKCYQLGKYDEVRTLLEDIEAKGYEEDSYWVHHTLGTIYLHGWGGASQDETKASFYFEKASQKKDYRIFSGLKYYKEQKYQLAWANFKEIEAIYRINPQWFYDPNNRPELGQTFCHLGYIYNEGLGGITKDSTKACTYFEKASKLGCQDGSLTLGEKYYKDGNYSKAEKLLEQVLESDYKDQDGSVNYELGTIYQKKGEIEKAKKHYQQAYEIDAKNKAKNKNAALKNAALKLGLICYEQGNNSEALKYLKSCSDVPKKPDRIKKRSGSNVNTPARILTDGLDITKDEKGKIYKVLSILYEEKSDKRGITLGQRGKWKRLHGEYSEKSKEALLK